MVPGCLFSTYFNYTHLCVGGVYSTVVTLFLHCLVFGFLAKMTAFILIYRLCNSCKKISNFRIVGLKFIVTIRIKCLCLCNVQIIITIMMIL